VYGIEAGGAGTSCISFYFFELVHMHYRCVQICRSASLCAYSETASAIFLVYSGVFSSRIIFCLLTVPHLPSDVSDKLQLVQLHIGFWCGHCF
jgi:hypothetical protein